MFELGAIPFVVQLMIPLGMLLWLALAHHRSHLEWLLAVALVVSYLVVVSQAGVWLMLPATVPVACGFLLVAALPLSLRGVRGRSAWPRGARGVAGATARAALVVLVLALGAHIRGGRGAPAEATELAFPLRQGTYSVVNGGGVELLNGHIKTLQGERFQPYRGQSYGVDLVRIGTLGRRARGLLPRELSAYAIYGDTVVAPCGGVVAVSADGFPDMPPPAPDRRHMAGNHVIVVCDSVWVVLAHFQRGSVRVRRGDAVRTGDPLGLVGNSGNTNEPHLHIHAQQPGTENVPLGGAPLSIRLDGRYVVRNDRVTRWK